MKILVLGGTVFLGRAFVEKALSEGHQLTLFHRGQHGADLFPEARHVLGDRDGGLGALPDEQWDAVVDCCGYFPRVVRQSAEHLLDRVGRYLFVSTISVYADPGATHQDESYPVGVIDDPSVEEITGESYGPLKALCEAEVLNAYGSQGLVIRPGLIAGPFDPTNRFTYWADRFAQGGRLIVPDRLEQPFQMIDVRDLAAFMLKGLRDELQGTFNVTGPDCVSTLRDMVFVLSSVCPEAVPVPVPEALLKEHEIAFWQDLPLTLSADDQADGMMRVNIDRGMSAGLSFRPWAETARDTHDWSTKNPNPQPRHGLDSAKEDAVLKALDELGQLTADSPAT
ncbi:MAG: NAD-dependent epimerase/dehydratase family protein [Fimbriimonas sp.]